MPTYMDIHEIPGVTAEAVAAAHLSDVETQAKYGVEYHKYWLNEAQGKVFCLCSAPDPEAAMSVHREAHGLVAVKIVEVAPEVAEGFLGGSEVDSHGAAVIPGNAGREYDSGIRTILFTDIVDSTALTQRLGDDAGMAVLTVHDEIVRSALHSFGGREVKHTGDGVMAAFVSAAAAVRCAIQIHQELADRARTTDDPCVKVRIGAAAGEPVESNRDLFGSTVQLASRLCSHAAPEQSLVSNVIAELCIGKNLAFEDLGHVILKGFDQAVQVHAVQGGSKSTG
ncbi:MAG TPA: nickel-binding protein [Candidatus Binatia bacterium]|nr:nickel-binding protein [Candidatus Binatia bacterium]